MPTQNQTGGLKQTSSGDTGRSPDWPDGLIPSNGLIPNLPLSGLVYWFSIGYDN